MRSKTVEICILSLLEERRGSFLTVGAKDFQQRAKVAVDVAGLGLKNEASLVCLFVLVFMLVAGLVRYRSHGGVKILIRFGILPCFWCGVYYSIFPSDIACSTLVIITTGRGYRLRRPHLYAVPAQCFSVVCLCHLFHTFVIVRGMEILRQ